MRFWWFYIIVVEGCRMEVILLVVTGFLWCDTLLVRV